MHPILAKVVTVVKYGASVELFHRHRGHIIGLFAVVETTIDMANSYAWKKSDRSISKVVPKMLRWKLETFAEAHSKVAEMYGLSHLADRVAKGIRGLADDRHWLAHGVVKKTHPTEGWTLVRANFLKDGSVRFVDRHFSKAELRDIEWRTQKLALLASRYSVALALQLSKERERNKSG